MPSRRSVLASAAALPALLSARPAAAEGHAPAPRPTVYRRPLGDGEIVTILDGAFALEEEMVTGLDARTYDAALRAAHRDPDATVPLGITVHLIRDGDRLTLIDAGAGEAFGPASGRLAAALEAAGVAAADVTEVILTHMHPDHVGGLMARGAAAFPEAAIRVSGTELAFWTDGAAAARAPGSAQGFFRLAERVAATYRERLETFEDGTDLGGGLSTMALPGHTPGQHGIRIDRDGASLLLIGDAISVAALQFSHPEAGISFDVDGETAVRTRRRLLDMAASDGFVLAGTHLPFPSYGRVEQAGVAWRWRPEPWAYDVPT